MCDKEFFMLFRIFWGRKWVELLSLWLFPRRLKEKNNADSLVPIEQWAAIQKIVSSSAADSPTYPLSLPPPRLRRGL
jgi:hypothetical protein